MIEAIKNIGEIELAHLRQSNGTILDIFIEDPSDGGKYNQVFFIKLIKQGGSFRYDGIEDRGYRAEAMGRYLYRSGSGGNGADLTPTAKLTEAKRTVPNKIIRAISDTLVLFEKDYNQETAELAKVKQVLEAEEKQIIADIQEKQNKLGKQGAKVIISLMVIEGDEEKWVGDLAVFRRKFQVNCEKLFAERYNKTAVAADKVCAVCLQPKEVFGFAGTFQFYTLDKPGYVAGGFRRQDAWKNYPVCFDCGAQLELGKKYIERHLTKSFCYRQLMITPKTLWPEDLPMVLKRLEARLTTRLESNEEIKKKPSEVESIGFAEEAIIDNLGSMGRQVTYNLMFFEEKQSGAVFNILLNIEDVLPSRLSYIYSELRAVNDLPQFKHFPVGEGEQSFKLRLGIFNELFPYKTHNRYFLEMIYALVANRPIDDKFLMSRLMEKITEKFNQPDNENKKFFDNYLAWRYFQLVIYLGRMRLLPGLFTFCGGEETLSEPIKYQVKDFPTVEAMFGTFFSNQRSLYNHPATMACFMVGYLSQHLIDFQRKKLEGMSFKVQMKSLTLKEKDVRDLVRKLQAKFMDYKDAYKDFYPCPREFELLAKYIQAAGRNWRISMSEIGFFIAVGMNGKNLFSFAKEVKENE